MVIASFSLRQLGVCCVVVIDENVVIAIFFAHGKILLVVFDDYIHPTFFRWKMNPLYKLYHKLSYSTMKMAPYNSMVTQNAV